MYIDEFNIRGWDYHHSSPICSSLHFQNRFTRDIERFCRVYSQISWSKPWFPLDVPFKPYYPYYPSIHWIGLEMFKGKSIIYGTTPYLIRKNTGFLCNPTR
jgi:hypothetical protein